MKLEQQVTGLEISKRLKELGVKQESWCWWDTDDNTIIQTDDGTAPTFSTGDARRTGGGQWKTDMKRTISAFTVAELGEVLPRRNKYWSNKLSEDKWSNDYWLEEHLIWIGRNEIGGMINGCSVQYVGETKAARVPDNPIIGTEVEARGRLLIYLLEKKLLNL